MILITNNEKTLSLPDDYTKIKESKYLDTLNIIEVFKTIRYYVHRGHKLLSHPLSGSVKPGETPFKSVLLSAETSELDLQSLLIIEDAISMANNFVGEHNDYKWQSEEILNDFSTIDYRLIESALQSSSQR